MKKLFILYLTFIVLLYSCAQNNRITKIPSTQPDTNRIVIFPFDLSKAQLYRIAETTALTEKEMIEVDKILNDCIDSSYKFNSQKMNSRRFLSNYKRQYFPSINEKGERLVWVNCFCIGTNLANNWKTEIVNAAGVLDGGDCFINVTINLTTKSFNKLLKNGYG